MAREEKNRWMGVLIGPALAFFSLVALWKNETRFDYHRAAQGTREVQQIGDATGGELLSYTGPMDLELTIGGQYVESFTGFLVVDRDAEIYAWDKDKDSDGHVTWDLEWSSSLESNSRNSGVRKELSSNRFLPPAYDVGELNVTVNMIEFVDSSETIDPATLDVKRAGLKTEGEYLYLRKHRSNHLGDERVQFYGVPVPVSATYFGKLSGEKGVPDTTHQRTGWINQLIHDTGILHHIVAGDRQTALATMKSHLAKVKCIVRGIGLVCVVMGFFIFFATILGALFHIPIIGPIAESGSFFVALAIGLPLGILTIVASYLVAHPLVLLLIIGIIVGGIVLIRRVASASRAQVKQQVDQVYGHQLSSQELKEIEFIELARLSMSDSELDPKEKQFLLKWGRRHGWDATRCNELFQKAKEPQEELYEDVSSDNHLMNLIQLAMADGTLSKYEINAIRRVAKRLGYEDSALREMINHVRQSAVPGASAS